MTPTELTCAGYLGPRTPDLPPIEPRSHSFWAWCCPCRLGFVRSIASWDGRRSSILGAWAAPAAQETIPEGGGLRPHLLEWFLGPPGPPRPQESTISGRPKNHVLKTQACTNQVRMSLKLPGIYSFTLGRSQCNGPHRPELQRRASQVVPSMDRSRGDQRDVQ